MSLVRLEKRVPEKNQHRFYRLLLAPTLFGEWSLIREWGRIGHSGTVRIDSYATEAEAAAELGRKAREKERRGYRGTRAPADACAMGSWPRSTVGGQA